MHKTNLFALFGPFNVLSVNSPRIDIFKSYIVHITVRGKRQHCTPLTVGRIIDVKYFITRNNLYIYSCNDHFFPYIAPSRDKLFRSLTLLMEVECTFVHDVIAISADLIHAWIPLYFQQLSGIKFTYFVNNVRHARWRHLIIKVDLYNRPPILKKNL